MSRGRGRPRDPRIEQAVREAVLAVLIEDGYDGVTFQRIALRAGVGQPALYRRWASKGDMVEHAIFPMADWEPPQTTGSLRSDIEELAASILSGLTSPAVRAAIPGLLVAYHEDPASHDRLVARAETPVRTAFQAMIDAAVERGEAAAVVGADTLFDVLLGTAMYRVLARNTHDIPAAAADLAALIEHTLRPTTPAPTMANHSPRQ